MTNSYLEPDLSVPPPDHFMHQQCFNPQQFGNMMPPMPCYPQVSMDPQYGVYPASFPNDLMHYPPPPIPVEQPSHFASNSSAPVKREKKVLVFQDPKSSEVAVKPESDPVVEESKNEVKERFQTEISNRAKETEEQDSGLRLQPSAPVLSDEESKKTKNKFQECFHAHVLGSEKKVDVILPPPVLPFSMSKDAEEFRPQQCTLESVAKEPTKDQKALLDLEQQFEKLCAENSEDIHNRVYDFAVLEMIHVIVKDYKKTQSSANPKLLKTLGMDVQNHSTPNRIFNQAMNQIGGKQTLSGNRRKDKNNQWNKAPLNQPVRLPSPVLHRAEKPWKPKKRGGEANLSEEEQKYEAFRKSVRSVLNKITPTTYSELIEDFTRLEVSKDERSRQTAVELIFEKAIEEPKFCELYTRVCKHQIDLANRATDPFLHAILRKSQSIFEGDSEIDGHIKELHSKLTKESDEAVKTGLFNQLASLENTEKSRVLGNIKFMSYLYAAELLADTILSACCSRLHKMFEHSGDDTFVRCGIELLELVAPIYFREDKKAARKNKPNAGSNNVSSFINWLWTEECKSKVSTKVRVLIMNLEDYFKDGRLYRIVDDKPKTLQEIQAEIRKKEELDRMGRAEYDYQKTKKDRLQSKPMMRSRDNLDQKRSNAVAASMNTGKSAPSQPFKLLRRDVAIDDPKLGKTVPSSYFAQKKSANTVKSSMPIRRNSFDKSAEKTLGPIRRNSFDKSAEKSTNKANVTIQRKPVEQIDGALVKQIDGALLEQVVEVLVDQAVENLVEQAVEEPVEQVVEESTEQSVENPDEAITKESNEKAEIESGEALIGKFKDEIGPIKQVADEKPDVIADEKRDRNSNQPSVFDEKPEMEIKGPDKALIEDANNPEESREAPKKESIGKKKSSNRGH